LDNHWIVHNSGSCNWERRYRIRLINADVLDAAIKTSIFPARAGMRVTPRIIFNAPQEPGTYFSEWQAFDPNGIPFGPPFFMNVIVP
jgi:hypothetical protein